MPEFDIHAIAEALDDDGDSVEIPSENGTWTFRLHIDHDDLSYEDMEDPEMFGKIAGIDRNGHAWFGKWRAAEPRQRPPEFTGAARIQWSESSQGDRWWYEPPDEFKRFKGSGWDDIDEWRKGCENHARAVRSIISWGYQTVMVTAEHHLPDGYHRKWSESLGGIEAEADRAYLDTVFNEVLAELISEIS